MNKNCPWETLGFSILWLLGMAKYYHTDNYTERGL